MREMRTRRLLFTPYPHLRGEPVTRFLTRATLVAAGSRVLDLEGMDQIGVDRDPFILVLNHTTALEALLVPGILMHFRQGRRVHFLADWNFMLVPPVALFYKCGQVIPVASKPARPAFLNRFRSLCTGGIPSQERARQTLLSGRSIGIFPEGTRNPSATHMLAGRPGAARLSIQTGVPVIPGGLVYTGQEQGRAAGAFDEFSVRIGSPMTPPKPAQGVESGTIAEWHSEIMRAVARQCGKVWSKDLKT